MPLDFKDTAILYPISKDGYGNDIAGEGVTVPCLYEQTTSYGHSNSEDTVSGTSRYLSSHLFLPGDNDFIVSKAERLEGMLVEVNPFGGEDSQQLFRIRIATPMRDILLGNTLQHVECSLEKIAGVKNVS